MSLIGCLEGLTSRKDNKQWEPIDLKELGTYSKLSFHELWTHVGNSNPSLTEIEEVATKDAVAKLTATPGDASLVGGISILVFHKWEDAQPDDKDKPATIRDAMAALELPLWLPARLLTHAFYCDPSNRTMANTRNVRRYWQRFRGGLLLWSHDMKSRVTRALFLCREEQYWDAFKQNLLQCKVYVTLPLLPGVLAYIQQIKVSVSYIYWVRGEVNGLLEGVNTSLKIVDNMTGEADADVDEGVRMHNQLAQVEDRIWNLVRCAQEAASAIPYLTDNSGNLNRVQNSLAYIKEENNAYCEALRKGSIEAIKKVRPDENALNQSEQLSGLIDGLTVELKSQSLAADWIVTKINALIQNTNLTINRADQRINLLIADSSLTTAIESRRDNLSMVTIAAITMVFLPGTFVASFFAMPILNWDADKESSVVTEKFWVYWTVTAPLTIVVILCWMVCFWRKHVLRLFRRAQRRIKEGKKKAQRASLSSANTKPDPEHGISEAIVSTTGIDAETHKLQYRPPRKTPTSDYRMAPRPRIDWSNKGSTIMPVRYTG